MTATEKYALVTGAAHRVGKSIAMELARQGLNIAVHYNRSADAAAQTAEEIRALGMEAFAYPADLADPLMIGDLMAAVNEKFGRLDVLVNSASTFQPRDALDIRVEEWDWVMNVNLRAPFLCSQVAAQLMDQGGVIVNIADIAGIVPWARFPHHSVSKAGVIMLTKVLAKSFAPDIRVNAVVPGPVLKPEGMDDERWEEISAPLPLKRPGSPENVARAVWAMIDNNFITGSILHVDGGDALIGSVD